MEDILLQELSKLVEKFPEAEFKMEYFDNNTRTMKVITNENLSIQS